MVRTSRGEEFEIHHDRTVYRRVVVRKIQVQRVKDEETLQEVAAALKSAIEQEKKRDEAMERLASREDAQLAEELEADGSAEE